jgi:hypothetical protein
MRAILKDPSRNGESLPEMKPESDHGGEQRQGNITLRRCSVSAAGLRPRTGYIHLLADGEGQAASFVDPAPASPG